LTTWKTSLETLPAINHASSFCPDGVKTASTCSHGDCRGCATIW
jgi:hypothetical protein